MTITIPALLLCFVGYINCSAIRYGSRDLSLNVDAKGEDVVDATVQKVQAVFNEWQDYTLLKRLALVESNFGEDNEVMSTFPQGGIWQVSDDIYNKLRENVSSSDGTSPLINKMQNHFHIDCLLCDQNFSTPLKSALVARLFIDITLGELIPITIKHQALWWAEHYHNNQKQATVFEEKVKQFEEKDTHIDRRLDLWFMLDASENTNEEQFKSFIDFIKSMASKFHISPSKTRLGLSLYSDRNEIIVNFEDTTNLEDFLNIANSTIAMKINKTTERKSFVNALQEIFEDRLKRISFRRRNSSVNFEQAIIFITKQEINDVENSSQLAELLKYMESNTSIVFGIGVGDEVTETQLSLMTTKPKAKTQVLLQSFEQLSQTKERNETYQHFCDSLHAYNKKESNYLCTLICITYVEDVMKENTERTKEEITQKIEEIFKYNCSTCETYTAEENRTIRGQFELEIEKDSPSRLVLNVFKYAYKKNNVSEEANSSTTSPAPDGVCGDIEITANIWFLIDGSSSVTDQEFQFEIDFAKFIASKLFKSNDPNKVQFGLSVYASEHVTYLMFTNDSSLEKFNESAAAAIKPATVQLGNSLENTLEQGFSSDQTKEDDDPNVERSLIVIGGKGSEDDLSNSTKLIEEKDVVTYAVGVGSKTDVEDILELATEPDHKYRLDTADDLEGSLVKQMAENLAQTPLSVSENKSIKGNLSEGIKRQFSTSIEKNENLRIVLSTTEDLDMYLGVGNDEVNSALHDVSIYVEKGKQEILIESDKLMELHSELENKTMNLTIAFIPKTNTQINVSFHHEKKNQTEIIIKGLNDIIKDCKLTDPNYSCTTLLQKKLVAAEGNISSNQLAPFWDEHKKLLAVGYLQNTSVQCEKTLTKSSCVKQLKEGITNAENQNVSKSDINKFYELFKKYQKEEMFEELSNITENCKKEIAKDVCIVELEEKLAEAKEMDFLETDLKQFDEALKGFQTDSGPDDTPDTRDFQIANTNLGIIIALTISIFVVSAILGYRKTRKRKIQPDPEKRNLNDILEDLKDLTEKALTPEATFTCMNQLMSLLSEAEGYDVLPEDLENSQKALKHLQDRIEKFRESLKKLTQKALNGEATSAEFEELQDCIEVAECIEIPVEELEEARKSCGQVIERRKLLDEIENLTTEAEESSLPSAIVLKKLTECLEKSSSLRIQKEHIQKSYDVMDSLKDKIDDVLEGLRLASKVIRTTSLTNESVNRLEEQLERAEQFRISSPEVDEAKANYEQAKQELQLIEELQLLISEANQPSASKICVEKLQEKLLFAKEKNVSQEHLRYAEGALERLEYRLNVLDDLITATAEAKSQSVSIILVVELQKKLSIAQSVTGIPSDQLHESFEVLNESKEKLRNEAENADHIDEVKGYVEELGILTKEAFTPTATMLIFDELQAKLNIADSLNIPKQQLASSFNALEELQDKINNMKLDLQTVTDKCRLSTANYEDLNALKLTISHAEEFLLPLIYLSECKDVREKLQASINRVIKNLQELTNKTKQGETSAETISELEEQYLLAKTLHLPSDQLEESQRILNGENKIPDNPLRKLVTATEEAMQPNATLSNLTELQEQLALAKSMNVHEDKLKESLEAEEKLKSRIDNVTRNLQELTNKAKQGETSPEAISELQEQFLLAKTLHFPSDQLEEPQMILNEQNGRVDAVLRKLITATKEAMQPNATMCNLTELQEQLVLAKSMNVHEDKMKESLEAEEVLKSRIDNVMKQLEVNTQSALDPTEIMKSMEELEEQIQCAVDLKMPEEKLQDSINAIEVLRNKVNDIEKHLDSDTAEAQQLDANFATFESLQQSITLAERLQYPSEKIKDSYNALETLNQKLIEKTQNDMMDFTKAADTSEGTYATLTNLKETIEIAEKLQIPAEKLKESYASVEKMTNRVNTVMKDLETFSDTATLNTSPFACLENLQEQIVKAEELQITPEQLQQSYQAIEVVKNRVDTVTKSLETATFEASQPTATIGSLEVLKEQIMVLQSLQAPDESLKDSYNAMEKLTHHVDGVYKDVIDLTKEVIDLQPNMENLDNLQEKLLVAENLGFSPDQLKDTYAVIQTYKQSIDSTTKELSDLTSSIMCGDMNFVSLEQLEIKLALAENMQISSNHIQEAYNAVTTVKEHKNVVKKDLQSLSEASYESTADFTTLQNFEKTFAEAEKLIPEAELSDYCDAFERLKFNIDKSVKDLEHCTQEASLSTSSGSSLKMLEEYLSVAENFNIPAEKLAASKDVLSELSKKDAQVQAIKKHLQDVIANPQLESLTEVLNQARATSYLLTWQRDDVELVDMFERAAEMEEDLRNAPEETPEDVTLRNNLRDELQAALENDADSEKLKELSTEFKKSLGVGQNSEDRELLNTAKMVIMKKTKQNLMKVLNGSIKSRDSSEIKQALNEVNQTVQRNIRQAELVSDLEFKFTFEKAKDILETLAALEKMKAAIMSLKQPTISEIRSYSQPPQVIELVMQATFILLGEDPRELMDWVEIQALIGKMGKDALKRRIWEKDISEISISDAEKAKNLLLNLKMDEIEEISKAASTFFAWSKCVLIDVEDRHANMA